MPRGLAGSTNFKGPVVTEPELCRVLGIHRNTAAAWRRKGILVPVGGRRPYLYSARRVIAMIDEGIPMGDRRPERNGDELRRRAASDYARLRRVQALLRKRERREDRESRGRASRG